MKALNIPRALIAIVGNALLHKESLTDTETAIAKTSGKELAMLEKVTVDAGLVLRRIKYIPKAVADVVKAVTTENAGVPYKTNALTGDDYLRQSEDLCIKGTLGKLPNVKVLQILEEKYSFTPDLFKAATRAQRVKKTQTSIDHLKVGKEIVNETTAKQHVPSLPLLQPLKARSLSALT